MSSCLTPTAQARGGFCGWWARALPTKWSSPLSPAPCSPEAGFSLVEVLAALTIASFAVVAALTLFTQSARVNDRLIKETAARDLVRRLLATGEVGRGQAGDLGWVATLSQPLGGLVRHEVAVTWQGGVQISAVRLDAEAQP
ncbi:MAG: type II secretion system protein [Pseudomonadota bacterium]